MRIRRAHVNVTERIQSGNGFPMKKVALYSSSNRSRKAAAEEAPAETKPAEAVAPAPAQGPSGGPATGTPDAGARTP